MARFRYPTIILAVSLIPLSLASGALHAQPRNPYAPVNWDQGSAGAYAGQRYHSPPPSEQTPAIAPYQNPQAAAGYSGTYHNGGNLPDAAHNFATAQGRFLQELNRAASAALPQQTHQARSALEDMYTARVVDDLSQFGYDLFGVPQDNTRTSLMDAAQKSFSMPSGAVQDDFIIDIGDQVDGILSSNRNTVQHIQQPWLPVTGFTHLLQLCVVISFMRDNKTA